jgi:hypothetical protein
MVRGERRSSTTPGAMQYDPTIQMTLYPHGPGETADVIVDHNPDPAVAVEIERIHGHEARRTSVGLIECRMHDNDVRPDLVARRCACHDPARVHGLWLIPKRFPEAGRERPERLSQYHLFFAHAPMSDGSERLGSHAVECVEHRLLKQYSANAFVTHDIEAGIDDLVLPKLPGMRSRRRPDVWAKPRGDVMHTFEMQFRHCMTAAEAVRLTADHRIAGAATTSWVGATDNSTLAGFNWRVPIVRTNPNELLNMNPGSRTAIRPARALEWERENGVLVPRPGTATSSNGDLRRFTLDQFLLEVVEGLWVPGALPDGSVFFMSPTDAATLADYLAERKPKAQRQSAWTPVLRKHPDAPTLPLTAEQLADQQARAERERSEREQTEQGRLERKRIERELIAKGYAETLERQRLERERAWQERVEYMERWNREQQKKREVAAEQARIAQEKARIAQEKAERAAHDLRKQLAAERAEEEARREQMDQEREGIMRRVREAMTAERLRLKGVEQ